MINLRIERQGNGLLNGHIIGRIQKLRFHFGALVPRHIARGVIKVGKFGKLFRCERTVLHHAKGRHIIIVHVALGRIGDLDKV